MGLWLKRQRANVEKRVDPFFNRAMQAACSLANASKRA
jgi:hypothetical protein